MSQVNYRFYEDQDAGAVLDLFRRNDYYLGKRPVSVEQFRQSLVDRGTYFAAVGEDDETIIAYLAAYPSGDGKVCKNHQILFGGLLVDEKYRGKLYSISTIYTMMVLRVARMNAFTTIIGEVKSFRKQSLLMHRYFGSVNVNQAVPHDPLDNQMYNFLPGYFSLFDEGSVSRKEKMTNLLPKPDRRSYDKEDEIIDGEYVYTTGVLSYGKIRMLNHIHTGIIDEVELTDLGLLFGLTRDRKQFVVKRSAAGNGTAPVVMIRMYENGTTAQEITIAPDEVSRVVPVDKDRIDRIRVEVEGTDDAYLFFPIRFVEIKGPDLRELWAGHTMDLNSGIFKVSTGSCDLLDEMWPFMMPPYLIGEIDPYYGMNLEQGDGPDSFVRKCADHIVQREYRKNGNEITIKTVVKSETPLELKPKFQFVLRDDQAKVVFTPESGGSETVLCIDEERDNKIATKELPFERFVSEPYSRTPFQKITVETGDGSYTIITECPATAYLQFNYIGIDYDMDGIPYTDGTYDFGEIRIIGDTGEK